MRFIRILVRYRFACVSGSVWCSSITTQTPTTKEPATVSYASAIEPFYKPNVSNATQSLFYDWAKRYSKAQRLLPVIGVRIGLP